MGTTKHTRRISLLCRAPLHRLINRGVRKSLVPIASVARAPERTNGSRLGAISLRRKIKNLPQKKLAFHKLVSKIVQEKTTEAPPDAFPPPGTTPGEDPFSTVCLAASRLGLAVPDPVATDPTPMADCAEILVDQGDLCGVLDDEVARLRLEREVHGLANADRLRALASRMGEARGALLGTRLGSVALCRRLKGAPAGRAAVPVEVEQQGAFLALLDVMR
ncbi:unnamed protein product [Ostreobium quekettii]|uniref:Uncharacterized protein n=1 Tax=Ostreobium quekettii TaxID=121088 RepID=A0A8S1IW28_9CHLO|nr:unnamed protein product [Ostreobium quekettii]|eukprot:evm.model.scf_439.6 EVM.evm.TU.scf_439.6   scf_439:40312-45042(+)